MSKRSGTKKRSEEKDIRCQRPERAEIMKTEVAATTEISNGQKSLQKLDAPVTLEKVDDHGELMRHAHQLVASMYGVHDMKLAAQLVDQATRIRAAWSSGDIGNPLEIAMTTLMEMKPETITEAMLAVQMAAVHHAGMVSLQKSVFHLESSEHPDMYMNRAIRLMRLFHEQAQVMAKLKSGVGHQEVRVEHVHVHEGGQAIVGTVTARSGKKEEQSGAPQLKPG